MNEAAPRLLPWSSPNGSPCYLLGDGTGPVARVADDIERLQIGMADELLDHADYLLTGDQASSRELRFLARGLTCALRDVRRVAESRGARLTGAGQEPCVDRGGEELPHPPLSPS